MNLPGWKLHALKGALAGHWAAWVSGNWRLTFAFDGTPGRRAATATTSWPKRAALFESLAVNHPFVDGNKRVAFAAVDVFLHINGWRLPRGPMRIHAETMRMFESGTFDIAHLEPWLRSFASPAG